jgi:DNA-binding response OmpR family regulator
MSSNRVFLHVTDRQPDAPSSPGPAGMEEASANMAQGSPSRILVVEDEMLIQMLATQMLEELGFEVEVASSATEAKIKLDLLEGQFDALILDIGLPDERGDVVLGEIRAIYPTMPVLFTSGRDEATLRTQFAGLELVGILSKPYVLEQLRSALSSVGALASAR